MKYFEKDFLQFFKDLAANNNRDWFLENKKRYEQSVKKPFEVFVAELISTVQKDDKSVQIIPSDAIFRINRDIRFSKDKTPYKLNASAAIAPGGRKSTNASGLYVELGPEKLGIAGGIYIPDKEQLAIIRTAIAKNPKALTKVLEDKTFKKLWVELQGERNKILPPEFKKAAADCPYIFNKQFYYWTELDSKVILSDKLVPTILEYYNAAKPVSKYLKSILD